MTPAEQERAAVVAWLRRHSRGLRARSERQLEGGNLITGLTNTVSATAWSKAADAIERREHLSNEAKGG